MVKLGQYKVPFGLQELISSGSQQLVDRSLVSNAYFRGRDTGVSVWGVLGNNKLEYRAGLFNGNGLTRSANDNDKFQYNARLSFQPNGAVPLGTYSGAHQSESDFETRALGKPIFVVSGAFEHTVNMQAKGQRMRAFVLQGRAPQIVLGINPHTMPDYKSIADLKGRKIGVTAPGSSTNFFVNALIAREGLKADDVSIIGVGT